jgi:hypothetical protein
MTMTLEGHIENGHVVFNTPVVLPEGTKVTVSVQAEGAATDSVVELPTLFDRLQSVAGKAKGLPADLAINHDHYLHGQPKRQ